MPKFPATIRLKEDRRSTEGDLPACTHCSHDTTVIIVRTATKTFVQCPRCHHVTGVLNGRDGSRAGRRTTARVFTKVSP